ncbi:MAG: tetratricopeptide repeat protein [Spirochaetes bacterium]|nr:tetratricopeptide repeat protein [Spirochaetota bacterium]
MRGKDEIKEQIIEYSPQELEEIDRILNRVSIETLESDITTTSIPEEPEEDFEEEPAEILETESDELSYMEESPEEISDFEDITASESELTQFDLPEESDKIPDAEESIEEITDFSDLSDHETELTEFDLPDETDQIPVMEESLEEITDFTDLTEPETELAEAELFENIEFEEPDQLPEQDISDSGDEAEEIQDITDLIRDIDQTEPSESPFNLEETAEAIQDLEELAPDDLLSEDFSLPVDIEGEPSISQETEDVTSFEDDLLSADFLETADETSIQPLQETEESIESPPEEFDLNMLDKELGEIPSFEESAAEPAEELLEENLEDMPIPDFERADDADAAVDETDTLLDENFLEEYEQTTAEASAETTDESEASFEEMDIGNLEDSGDQDFDLQVEEMTSIDETAIEESSVPEMPDSGMEEAEDFSAIDFESLELPDEQVSAPASSNETHSGMQEPELSIDFETLDDQVTHAETAAVIPDIEEIGSAGEPSYAQTDEGIDLSDSELKQLKKVIQFFQPALTREIKNVIINDQLPAPDIRKLVDMLLGGKSEQEVKNFLESKSGKKIDISGRRKVITARAEYTREGRERQKRLFKITRIFGIAAVAAFLITIFSYQFIYKPVMAKNYIKQGVVLIRKPGVPALQKQKDYREAEDIFKYVDENYIEDYLYGYNEYAKAYLQNKEFDSSLKKLNEAYEIDSLDVDTLNNLGHFYSKIPERQFRQIKPDLNKYYYSKVKPVGPVDTQLDVAIDFYKKSLNADPENITALYGIGNAYISQGQNRKARDYFENIIKVDKNSIIGYSGLLNLYIERDAFPEIITIHSDLKYKKKLSELPSPLLAKLASYYLGKKKSDDRNIRIDYGIQSPVIKDINDNPYPAVKDVLNALSERDLDYPPMFVLFAKLSEQEGNYNLMKRNLLTSLEKEPNYFASNLLMGKFYYVTNEPVEAYRYCKKAIKAYLSPPEFTNEDFYHESENIGNAYAIMGNIFYYYFDKMKFRFGDEFEDDTVHEQTEKLANIEIAQDKYEKAISENYKTSEVTYNLGKIYYNKGNYEKAVTTWLNLYEDHFAQPELMLALGNAYYHQNILEAGKGEFLKVISIYEDKEEKLLNVIPGRAEHTKIYQTLSTAYNNLGAVYQIQNKETKSNISYWRSIEYAKKIERENEYARINLGRAFKPGRENVLPVLDESLPESIDAYKDFVR